ncbi:MAG: hypothetical protein IPK81_08200 [Rhodospirillales bacterium]|nr:MAG: hypothetical protein IPK81_08200 [Rhodospirillales bacterium]
MDPKPYVIDVVDMSGEGGAHFKEMLKNYGGGASVESKMIEIYAMSNAVARMIDLVMAAAEGQYGSIKILGLWGHGLVDARHVGVGVHAVTGGWSGADHGSTLSYRTLTALGPALGRLRGYFAPDGRFEIRGCGVARGDGFETMKLLAYQWDVEVQGGEGNGQGLDWGPPVWSVARGGRTATKIAGKPYDRRL